MRNTDGKWCEYLHMVARNCPERNYRGKRECMPYSNHNLHCHGNRGKRMYGYANGYCNCQSCSYRRCGSCYNLPGRMCNADSQWRQYIHLVTCNGIICYNRSKC